MIETALCSDYGLIKTNGLVFFCYPTNIFSVSTENSEMIYDVLAPVYPNRKVVKELIKLGKLLINGEVITDKVMDGTDRRISIGCNVIEHVKHKMIPQFFYVYREEADRDQMYKSGNVRRRKGGKLYTFASLDDV